MKESLSKSIQKMLKKPIYAFFVHVLGCLSLPFILFNYFRGGRAAELSRKRQDFMERARSSGLEAELYAANLASLERKERYFEKAQTEKKRQDLALAYTQQDLEDRLQAELGTGGKKKDLWAEAWTRILKEPMQCLPSLLLSWPLYLLALIYAQPYTKYICERLFMMLFVIVGVTMLVFTLLYLSPMDPAKNVLGELATKEQVAEFNRVYHLDQPYLIQLKDTIVRLFTFDLGKSYIGSEDVFGAFIRKFPITLSLTISSVLLALFIAVPAGVISAIKQYSGFDYVFMIIALIGLSIPNFWLGLILILNFSIRLHWLPASYVVGNWTTLIMPAVVLGTGMSASSARIIRSSMLEVKNMGYIMTARAKGLSERKVILRHILGNAMIPIVTIVGLQFGSMLGGAGITEKVFNISGIGSYIVDKQFIPDVPIVLAGVVYVALTISLANLLVDLLYTFLDPRIKSKLKSY